MKVIHFPQASDIIQKVKEKLMDSLKGPREFQDFCMLCNNVCCKFYLCTSPQQKPSHGSAPSWKHRSRRVSYQKSSELSKFSVLWGFILLKNNDPKCMETFLFALLPLKLQMWRKTKERKYIHRRELLEQRGSLNNGQQWCSLRWCSILAKR